MMPVASVITFIIMVSMVAEIIIEFQVAFFAKVIYFSIVTMVSGVHSLL